MRQRAIDVLGSFDSAEALVPLIESLHDKIDMVKSTAARFWRNQKILLDRAIIDSLNDRIHLYNILH